MYTNETVSKRSRLAAEYTNYKLYSGLRFLMEQLGGEDSENNGKRLAANEQKPSLRKKLGIYIGVRKKNITNKLLKRYNE